MCDLKRCSEKAEITFICEDLEKFNEERGIYMSF